LVTGERDFRFLAVPDVDTDFRQNALGGEWGDRAMDMIEAAREKGGGLDEPEARRRVSDAARHADPPLAGDFFVSAGTGGSPSLSVTEDAVPIDEPVTVLGTYVAGSRGLDGRRLGGMKVFKGTLDERLLALGGEIRKGLKVGLPSLALGVSLMTLVWWWPG
jgi:hypothetical protein